MPSVPVPMGPLWPMIVYPSEPQAPTPTLGSVAGGALPARTYMVAATYTGLYGESGLSVGARIDLKANTLLTVSLSVPPSGVWPFGVSQFNTYVGPTISGWFFLQTPPTSLSGTWTEPTTGATETGPIAPQGWGTVLQFRNPAVKVPWSHLIAVRHDSYSTSGVFQSVVERIEQHLEFNVDFSNGSDDTNQWQEFMQTCAMMGQPFDYYPDSTAPEYGTYYCLDTDWDQKYRGPGIYNWSMKLYRQVST